MGLFNLVKKLDAENLILVANITVVSLIGTGMFVRNLRVMNKENHFEDVDHMHLPLEKCRNIKHPSFMYKDSREIMKHQ
ncbi:hypothetical protein PPL_05423 [Heterostelium album PN500]|uniref:Uncharacterized protein n=1 Tax=Heterostelium pallidum (strain ATCC 26659 / Pp 5 / PN500) TaxID=670386 RepID=D3BA48_HETP5|nr:hypothetical protein PPL_05423 [Heterostelium album PN500]EFA81435.1 hypothetical protein PPL_05423 [Heterostelium album PN500]|eukprot:XP_020433553.1 hypothetical protein PPL_05423 [Heterostelium album PN500]